MITNTMSKYEVMEQLRKEFDEEILPTYYKRILPSIKPLLYRRCQRENKTISLGWETIKSKNLNIFKILKRGNKEGDIPLFVAEFRWNNKLCFAHFAPQRSVIVYQAHCLLRYAERVLKQEFDATRVFYYHIVKRQFGAYRIVLPTRTHKHSFYFGIAKALFLGDFDDENPKDNFIWLNTCISYDEAKYSQYRIMQTLHELQYFIEKVQDFADPINKVQLEEYLKKHKDEEDKLNAVRKFLIQYYLLLHLHLSFKFTFTKIFKSEIDARLEHLNHFLLLLNVDVCSLSPFSKNQGIAWKGEIDYIALQN